MRHWLIVAVLTFAGLAFGSNRASAWWNYYPQPASVSFPMVYPPGYYTNTYYFPWYYPWYANYNYSHGSYANWWKWHGWAFYYGQPIPHNFRIDASGAYMLAPPKKVEHKKEAKPKKESGTVSISLPADAVLTFNGVAATGTGDSRIFRTPDLEHGRDYEYVLSAEVKRDGQTYTDTKRVIVRAGSDTQVSLDPSVLVRR